MVDEMMFNDVCTGTFDCDTQRRTCEQNVCDVRQCQLLLTYHFCWCRLLLDCFSLHVNLSITECNCWIFRNIFFKGTVYPKVSHLPLVILPICFTERVSNENDLRQEQCVWKDKLLLKFLCNFSLLRAPIGFVRNCQKSKNPISDLFVWETNQNNHYGCILLHQSWKLLVCIIYFLTACIFTDTCLESVVAITCTLVLYLITVLPAHAVQSTDEEILAELVFIT